MKVILTTVPGSFLIDKLRAIIDMEADYKFLAKLLVNKLLIPRGESSGLITEEAFIRYKDHIEVEVYPCRCLLYYRLRQIRIPLEL